MVKSGSYEVNQGNIFGRIGSGIGKGLSEQLPKEMDRGRLSAGLKQFAENSEGLTPLQAAAQYYSIPGLTPQMAQALPELTKQQNLRNAYAKKSRDQGREQKEPSQFSNSLKNINFANQKYGGINKSPPDEFVRSEEEGQPQIVDKNPLRSEAFPRAPWSPDRRDQEIAKVFEEHPNLTLPEAVGIASDNEKRYLSQPESVQKQDDYLREQENLADQRFTKHLETKLQKSKEGVYTDITGENLVNLKRNMNKELRTNPNATIEDVANKWTNKALDLSKTKNQLSKLANSSYLDQITKSGQNLDKLKTYQKIYAQTGNQEEYYNTLTKDFNLSPQGAASIAFPTTERVNEYLNKVKATKINEYNASPINSRKYASDLENLITRDDSLLSIARSLSLKDGAFDQRAFFNQIREDMDNLGLTERQKREISEGESNFFPSWGDILLLPILRRG